MPSTAAASPEECPYKTDRMHFGDTFFPDSSDWYDAGGSPAAG